MYVVHHVATGSKLRAWPGSSCSCNTAAWRMYPVMLAEHIWPNCARPRYLHGGAASTAGSWYGPRVPATGLRALPAAASPLAKLESLELCAFTKLQDLATLGLGAHCSVLTSLVIKVRSCWCVPFFEGNLRGLPMPAGRVLLAVGKSRGREGAPIHVFLQSRVWHCHF